MSQKNCNKTTFGAGAEWKWLKARYGSHFACQDSTRLLSLRLHVAPAVLCNAREVDALPVAQDHTIA